MSRYDPTARADWDAPSLSPDRMPYFISGTMVLRMKAADLQNPSEGRVENPLIDFVIGTEHLTSSPP